MYGFFMRCDMYLRRRGCLLDFVEKIYFSYIWSEDYLFLFYGYAVSVGIGLGSVDNSFEIFYLEDYSEEKW